MTVQDLIDELSEMPPSAKVFDSTGAEVLEVKWSERSPGDVVVDSVRPYRLS